MLQSQDYLQVYSVKPGKQALKVFLIYGTVYFYNISKEKDIAYVF